jgi:hypothetical protein
MARALLVVAALGLALASTRTARATPPDPELLARLSRDEQALEHAGARVSYQAEQVLQELDGDGKVSSTKTMRYRVESDGKTAHRIVEVATDDGKDVTAAEQQKAREKEAKRAKNEGGSDNEPAWPFAPGSQARYTYDQVAVDPSNPAYVQIAFVPKSPDSHTLEGKVWVDAAAGRILSASVRVSKPPTFVDWVHFTAEFGATPAGPALSRLTFEGSGGLLFLRKHFRGEIKMSGWRGAP